MDEYLWFRVLKKKLSKTITYWNENNQQLVGWIEDVHICVPSIRFPSNCVIKAKILEFRADQFHKSGERYLILCVLDFQL